MFNYRKRLEEKYREVENHFEKLNSDCATLQFKIHNLKLANIEIKEKASELQKEKMAVKDSIS